MIRVYPEFSKRITDKQILTEYIHGGRGIVKLQAPSGNHHYYMFQKPSSNACFPEDVVFVYAVHDFQKKFYLGMIEQNQFRLTKSSRFLPDTDIVRGAFFIMNSSKSQKLLDTTPMKIYHMGMCGRCGRALEAAESVHLGFGPKCRKRLENGHTK